MTEEDEKRRKFYDDQLEPCPYCGEPAYIVSNVRETYFRAMCGNSDCRIFPKSDLFRTPEGAVKDWNEKVALNPFITTEISLNVGDDGK